MRRRITQRALAALAVLLTTRDVHDAGRRDRDGGARSCTHRRRRPPVPGAHELPLRVLPEHRRQGFDYLPRLVRQVTSFRPRSDLRQGNGRVVVRSSPYDPLGDVPVIGVPLFLVHGYWDNTMLPGRVVARAWRPRQFLKHAFFESDASVALLAAPDSAGPAALGPSLAASR